MEISEAILNEWKKQAEKDGSLEEYEYHLGMVYPPIPYRLWKMKKATLDSIQSREGYMDGKLSDFTYQQEDKLCRELGY